MELPPSKVAGQSVPYGQSSELERPAVPSQSHAPHLRGTGRPWEETPSQPRSEKEHVGLPSIHSLLQLDTEDRNGASPQMSLDGSLSPRKRRRLSDNSRGYEDGSFKASRIFTSPARSPASQTSAIRNSDYHPRALPSIHSASVETTDRPDNAPRPQLPSLASLTSIAGSASQDGRRDMLDASDAPRARSSLSLPAPPVPTHLSPQPCQAQPSRLPFPGHPREFEPRRSITESYGWASPAKSEGTPLSTAPVGQPRALSLSAFDPRDRVACDDSLARRIEANERQFNQAHAGYGNFPGPSKYGPTYHENQYGSSFGFSHNYNIPSYEMNGVGLGKQRKRRGNLPKETTETLRGWFLAHLPRPYPTEEQKQELMRATGLQMNQISNWFINARRRQMPALVKNAKAESAIAEAAHSDTSRTDLRKDATENLHSSDEEGSEVDDVAGHKRKMAFDDYEITRLNNGYNRNSLKRGSV